MQKLFILLIVGLFLMVAVPSPSLAVSVKGYYKKNGTYVAPYVRSSPNGLKYDKDSITRHMEQMGLIGILLHISLIQITTKKKAFMIRSL